ncbi:MAG: adenine nucleotide alpha hydrolase [Neisseriaceae bacterium]|nr:MAG: adenine nucleotide alpha hydrolase [Neisseriaceae bacterium]
MKTLLSWSGGKDCTLALYYLKNNPKIELVGLVCTISQFDRVGLHGTRKNLITKQAESLDLPVHFIITSADNYESDLLNGLQSLRNNNIKFESIAFGDIHLAELKSYREKILHRLNISAIFPLWQIPTHEISKQIIEINIKAILVCINNKLLGKNFLGKEYSNIVNELHNVDICGENGEFHTFVYSAPFFAHKIDVSAGQMIENTC